MRRFKLIFNPEKSKNTILANVDLSKLSQPLELTNQPILIDEEEPARMANRRKSEVIDEEDTNQQPNILLTDSENKTFVGKQMEMKNNYFTFFTQGSTILVSTVSEFQRFSLLNNSKPTEFCVVDYKIEREKSEEEEEIDFENKFDDDNSEDEIRISRVKKLSRTGKQMNHLVESFKNQEENNLIQELRRLLVNSEGMTANRLIFMLKRKFRTLSGEEKEIVKSFIKEECEIEESVDGKVLKMKK